MGFVVSGYLMCLVSPFLALHDSVLLVYYVEIYIVSSYSAFGFDVWALRGLPTSVRKEDSKGRSAVGFRLSKTEHE
jgi:hypothetical protein